MRIIKNGTQDNGKIRFVCKNCHCEFECRKDEYWENENTVSLTYPIQHECFANCPQCHVICRTYKKSHHQPISVTGIDANGVTYDN